MVCRKAIELMDDDMIKGHGSKARYFVNIDILIR